MNFSPATRRSLPILLMLLLWCALLIGVRAQLTGSRNFLFLAWNLFLAALPLLFAGLFRGADARSRPTVVMFPLFIAWLLFLPNAPYVLTDLIHLGSRPPVPLWYDLGLLLSAAVTALALGYVSLDEVHGVVSRRMGRRTGWLVAVGALFLSGFGIYLGRFLRWNSWELTTNPGGLLHDIADRLLHPASHPRTWGVTLLFGVALTLGYLLFRALRGTEPNVSSLPLSTSYQRPATNY